MPDEIDRWVKIYKKIDTARKEATSVYKKKDAALKEELEKVGNILLHFLQETGQEGSRTVYGTFWREIALKPQNIDWSEFGNWVIENGALEALEQRVRVSFLKTYIDEHGNLPPGVSARREYVVRVRRGKEVEEKKDRADEVVEA